MALSHLTHAGEEPSSPRRTPKVASISLPLVLAALAALAPTPSIAADPQSPARVEVALRQAAEDAPPIGVNEFGDMGGTQFSAGNLIPGFGFEPISIRRYWRVRQAGVENGFPWAELDGPGLTDWDLVTTGFLNSANFRVYRMVDSAGQPLPERDGYFDMDLADRYVLVGSGQVPAAGTPGLPFGGWVDTAYKVPGKVWGTRTSLDFTDARWVENGRTYYYIVTAIGSNSSEPEGSNESDPATAAEVSATPDAGAAGGPRIYAIEGDGFNEIHTRLGADSWFTFRPGVANATGTATWSLLDQNNQPLALPAGYSFNASTGELSGAFATAPASQRFRFRVSASNGSATRDFVVNNPAWTTTGGTTRPQPPTNVTATAGNGFVHLSWSPSPTPGVVGYRIYRAEMPRAQQRQRVYFPAGTAVRRFDYLYFDRRTTTIDPMTSHPRVRTGFVRESWEVHDNATDVALNRVPHPGVVPSALRFPGETCLEVAVSGSGGREIGGPYIFYPAIPGGEGEWYSQLEPGRTYRYEAWMRQSGLANGGRVRLGFNAFYDRSLQPALSHEFTVSGEWALHSFTFVAPPRFAGNSSHSRPTIGFAGPGTLWIENVRLFRVDRPEDETADFVPSPLVFDRLMASQPDAGEKGIIRSMPVMLNARSIAGNLTYHADASVTMDWYQAVGASSNMTLPCFLEYAFRTGTTPAERMKPWLNIASTTSEEEWLMLIEYLAAPIDPNDPDDIAAKPWAHLRYRQRGVATPWTDEFPRIYLEFANETWHNSAVIPYWTGWGPMFGVMQGGREFGLVARHVTEHVRDHSPYWSGVHAAGKLTWVMGSNYDTYAETGRPRAPLAGGIGHAPYVGPRWESGEEPLATYDDHGIQATLLGHLNDSEPLFRAYRRSREDLTLQGHPYRLLGYESGPSGYSLPGQATPLQVEYAERYGKSLAMAVAALDAWLGANQYGFSDQAFLAFQQGTGWSSHSTIPNGFNGHAAWLALEMRNRLAAGPMIVADVVQSPTIDWDDEELPLVGAYAFRSGRRLAVFLLSRKLAGVHDGTDFGDGSTPVTLVLPANPTAPATLYRLEGDPRATNRFSQEVVIQSAAATLGRETTVTLPQGSIHLYVVDTDLPDIATSPAQPATPTVTHASSGTTLTWPAVPGATGYTVFRSRHSHFARTQESESFTAPGNTFTDLDAVGGTTFYYRVAGTSAWGTGMTTVAAVGGTNTHATPLPPPVLEALGAGDGLLVPRWTAVSGATGYRVGIGVSPGGPYTWSDVGTNLEQVFAGLTNGTTYFVTVQASGPAGRSPEAVERSATPVGEGTSTILAGWDAAGLVYSDLLPDDVSQLPPAGTLLAVSAQPLTRGAGLVPITSTYGFDHGLYDGTFPFLPQTDSGNFGASPAGSLDNAIARNLYLTCSLAPAVGQSLALDALDFGFRYQFGTRALRCVVQYRIGSGAWQTLTTPAPLDTAAGTATSTNHTVSLAAETALRDVRDPVEFRLFTFSTSNDSRWHPATLHRTAGEDVVVRGSVATVGAPARVTGVAITTDPGRLTVSWLPVAGATTYTVHWSASPGGPSLGSITAADNPRAVIEGLTGGTTYHVTVTANNSFGAGPASTSVAGTAAGATRYFFGNFTTDPAGHFALYVRADNSAVFLGSLSDGTWFDAEAAGVAADGSFTLTDPVSELPVTGQIQGTTVAGAVGAHAFSGTEDAAGGGTAALAGFYEGVIVRTADGQVALLAGPSGRAFALSGTEGQLHGSPTSFGSDGEAAFELPGGVQLSLSLNMAAGRASGTYGVMDAATLSVSAWREDVVPLRRFANTSIRGQVGQGDGILIAGFVLAGSGEHELLVRGIGPSLGLDPFDLTGVLADPQLRIFRGSDPAGSPPIAANDDWSTAGNLAALRAAAVRLGAFDLDPASRDAAALLALSPGAYTAHLSGAADATGTALVEVYDAYPESTSAPRLVNISLRGTAGHGDNVIIAGFVISGNAPKRVLVRAVGSELARWSVPGTLSDPILRLYQQIDGQNHLVATNDSWSASAPIVGAVSDAVGAFPLDAESTSAALVIWLEPGIYTAIGASNDLHTGIALVEVYEAP